MITILTYAPDSYMRSSAALFASLSIFGELVKPTISCVVFVYQGCVPHLTHYVRAYLVAGTPQSALASHCIRAVVVPDDDDDIVEGPNVFQQLGLLRKVAQKAQESAANEKQSIARPAREARDALKALGDDALQGLF